jgi:hypothetical protein
MAHTAKQNPSNKVGRNSGAGPTGISALEPTERERERGVEPINLDRPLRRGWGKAVGFGIGALAVAGGAFTALRIRQARQERTLRGRLQKLVDRVRP